MKRFDPSMLFHISAIDEYRKLCYDKKDDAAEDDASDADTAEADTADTAKDAE